MNFVQIPKTASSSIAEAIKDEQRAHVRASEVPAPRFAFVRHPCDRLVSTWEFMRQQNSEKLNSYVRGRTFREFIEIDHLFLHPQCWWLDAEMAFIGRFEQLDEDFAKVSDAHLPHLNATERKPWPEYFDDDSLAFARKRYAEDFERFGYVAAI